MMTRGGFFRALIGGGAVGAGVELVRGRSDFTFTITRIVS